MNIIFRHTVLVLLRTKYTFKPQFRLICTLWTGKSLNLKPQYALSGGAIWMYATHFFGKCVWYETDWSV